MQVNRMSAINRYQSEQIHLDRSSRFEGGLKSNLDRGSIKNKKSALANDNDEPFDSILEHLIADTAEH